jgi:hypothetical protein
MDRAEINALSDKIHDFLEEELKKAIEGARS